MRKLFWENVNELTGEWPVVEHWFQIKYFLVKTTLFFCMSFCSDLKIQEVILDLNTRSYKIMRLPRWLVVKKNLPTKQETQVWSLGWEIPCGRSCQPTPAFCLGNRMDRGTWWATDHGAAELDTTERLSTAHNLCLDLVLLWILSYAYYLCYLT